VFRGHEPYASDAPRPASPVKFEEPVCLRFDGDPTKGPIDITSTLTKNHADTCSIPTLVFTIHSQNDEVVRETGPRICAPRSFEWRLEGNKTAQWVDTSICLSWSEFSIEVCAKP